jgi:hypothetical protein
VLLLVIPVSDNFFHSLFLVFSLLKQHRRVEPSIGLSILKQGPRRGGKDWLTRPFTIAISAAELTAAELRTESCRRFSPERSFRPGELRGYSLEAQKLQASHLKSPELVFSANVFPRKAAAQTCALPSALSPSEAHQFLFHRAI